VWQDFHTQQIIVSLVSGRQKLLVKQMLSNTKMPAKNF
jgi:hypothetical protein